VVRGFYKSFITSNPIKLMVLVRPASCNRLAPPMLRLSMCSSTPCLEIGTSSRDTYRYRGFHRSTSWPTLPAVHQDIKTRGVRGLATRIPIWKHNRTYKQTCNPFLCRHYPTESILASTHTAACNTIHGMFIPHRTPLSSFRTCRSICKGCASTIRPPNISMSQR
jgi:hypothetical protein